MDMNFGFGTPIGVFTFVLLIILIGNVFSWLRTRAQMETMREAIRSGQPIDPSILAALEPHERDARRGFLVGGLVTLAVAVALVVFGWQIARVTGDDQVAGVMLAVSAFPGLIGVALLIGAALTRERGA